MTDKEKKELEVTEKKEIDTSTGEPTKQGTWYVPEVDITESDEAIILFADVPGVRSENLDIDIREGVLTLTAEVEPVPVARNLVYREYEIGGYQRRFTVSDRIDPGRIVAKLDNGVLTLTLPKAEEHKPRKIKVT